MFEEAAKLPFPQARHAGRFFAETIVGQNMPSLTYMLGYDDLAARERMWREFGKDPDWAKLRGQSG